MLKQLPETEFLQRYLENSEDRLTRVTAPFQKLVRDILTTNYIIMENNRSALSIRPDIHSILRERLQFIHANQLKALFPEETKDFSLVLTTKLVAMFLGDQISKSKQMGLQSFRNSLK